MAVCSLCQVLQVLRLHEGRDVQFTPCSLPAQVCLEVPHVDAIYSMAEYQQFMPRSLMPRGLEVRKPAAVPSLGISMSPVLDNMDVVLYQVC